MDKCHLCDSLADYTCEYCEEYVCDDCTPAMTQHCLLEETVCTKCYETHEDEKAHDMWIDSLTEKEYRQYRYKEKTLKVLKNIINQKQ